MIEAMKKSLLFILIVIISLFLFLHNEIVWSVNYALHPPTLFEENVAPLPKCPGCNVILISMDTLRADHLGFLGSDKGLSPNLDKIASHSLVFPHAYANAFFTTPSHMTVFTSLYPQVHRVESTRIKLPGNPRSENHRHRLRKKYVTLAEVLQANGYQTVWNGPLQLSHLSLKDGFERGFKTFLPSPFRNLFTFDDTPTESFDARSLAPLQQKAGKVFLFLHSYLTHLPYSFHAPDIAPKNSRIPFDRDDLLQSMKEDIQSDATSLVRNQEKETTPAQLAEAGRLCTQFENMKPCFSQFVSADRFWQAVGQWQLHLAKRASKDPEELEKFREAYASGVRLLDKEIGELWTELETSGALKNTIVIFFSDHGEALFEQGEGSHSTFLEHTAHIPLLIYHPLQAEPLRINQWVSLIDIMPSLLTMLNIPFPVQTQGKSVDAARESVVMGYSLGNDYIRDPNWKLIRTYSGAEELYYLPADPTEKNNLIGLRTPWTRSAYNRLKNQRKNFELSQVL
jgi:arylsulfatase A-like enzyme